MFSINYAATHFQSKSFLTGRSRVYLITAKKSGDEPAWPGFSSTYYYAARMAGSLLTAVNAACVFRPS